MIILTVLGLCFTFFTYTFQFAPTVFADLLPAFAGLLALWYVSTKKQEKSRWFSDTGNTAVVFAVVHLLGYFAAFRDLLPKNTTFADSDIFRFLFTAIGTVYENGFLIFAALSFIPIQFLCRAFGDIAEKDDNNFFKYVFYVFSWIYIALIIFNIVVTFVKLPFGEWVITYPIHAVFIIFTAIFMKKYDLD